MLDQQEITAAVSAERLRLCTYLEGLTDAQWGTRSLCSEWTVREVVAHLNLATRARLGEFVVAAIRARGSFNRTMEQLAVKHAAAFTPVELLRQLRESAGTTRRPPGSAPMDPLMDVMVHGQDIARPLGRRHALSLDVAAPVLSYVSGHRMLGSPARLEGLHLIASDLDWSSGAGREVRGVAEDLLLVTAGRRAGLPRLTGPGVDLLAERLG